MNKYQQKFNLKKFLQVSFLVTLFMSLPVKTEADDNYIKLGVPFVTQIPDGRWVKPYSEACEESSIVMIDAYYAGETGTIGSKTSKQRMQPYFDYQNELYGDNDDSDAWRTADMVYSTARNFRAEVVEYPTMNDIQTELRAGRPVMTFHHGYSLQNKLIPFSDTPSSFHVVVLVGYDDSRKQFIVHEPGMREGGFYRYDYDVIMNSMTDYNHETGEASDPSRAIFTSAKKDREVPISQAGAVSQNASSTLANIVSIVTFIGSLLLKTNFVGSTNLYDFNYLQS